MIFGAIINVNIHSGWILFFILEKLSLLEVMQTQFGSSTNYFKRKKNALVHVRETFWKEKVQPGLRETQCIHTDLSFSLLIFFLSLPPASGLRWGRIWSAPTPPCVGAEPLWLVPELFPAPTPFRPQNSSLRHWRTFWNASTNTDKHKRLKNKHSNSLQTLPLPAASVLWGRPRERWGEPGHRVVGWAAPVSGLPQVFPSREGNTPSWL